MVGLTTLIRICQQTILLITIGNLVEQGSLCLGIVRTIEFRAFEHQVLQVVSQTGGLRRVILTTRPDSDIRLDTRFLRIGR